MRVVGPGEVDRLLDFPELVERLRQLFRAGCTVPQRQHYSVPTDAEDAVLLLMPAWQQGRHIGVKTVTVFPENRARGLATVNGVYLLFDGRTGLPQAVIDGVTLTLKRTAAASALAARYLAREDCERLLMVGAGALAPHLIQAHAAVRNIRHVLVWNRDLDRAWALAQQLNRRDFRVRATDDLEGAVRGAHIISCATMAREPLVRGEWLPEGAHLDLVGGFTPQMRETDDDAVLRARIFVDTREGALSEAGDIVDPLRRGIIGEADIAADLFELARGDKAGRRFYDQITLFKSVGTALEDLAAAQLLADKL